MPTFRPSLPKTLVAAILVLGSSLAFAQDTFPSRALRIVVPFTPGGSTDMLARIIAKGLEENLKQPVVVDNKPGAGGSIGAAMVAKSAPDGYTLLLTSSSLSTNAAIQTNLPFDTLKDLKAVAIFATAPFVMVVNNDMPVRTPRELVDEMLRHPGKYAYASAGPGSTNHFATELIKSATGASVVHVPYRGAVPAMTDLVAGRVHMTLATLPSLSQYIAAGRVRAIGITSPGPSPIAPQLSAFSTAIPGFDFEQWFGLLTTAGTPEAVVARLHAEINRVTSRQDFKDLLHREGARERTATPTEFGQLIAAEISRLQQVAREQDIRP